MEEKLIEDLEAFLPELQELKSKMRKKKAASKETISAKMQELHYLIDQWEERFIETANETLDEKIDMLKNQEKMLTALNERARKFLHDYAVEKKPPPPLLTVHKRANSDRWRASHKPTSNGNGDDDEDGSDGGASMSMETSMSLEEGEDDAFLEIRALLEGLAAVKFPLSAQGTKPDEVAGDHQQEFAELLDEASKSLKRTLTFIGGIVRGYLRKGHKSDKWVAMIRQLESRFENDQPVEAILESALNPQPRLVLPAMSRYVRVWKVVSDFWKYIENAPLRDEMIKVLSAYFKSNADEIEYYLTQLLNILFSLKIKELESFLLQKARENHNFALQIWFTACALGETQGSKKWTTRVKKFLKRIELALPLEEELGKELDLMQTSIKGEQSRFRNGLEPIEHSKEKEREGEKERAREKDEPEPKPRPDAFPSREVRRAGKDYFFGQVECMRELVDISAKLKLKFSQPETYKPEMRRLLEAVQERYVATGTAYLPASMQERHRILRINIDECFPIPTYGRVLYFLMVEVVPVPTNTPPDKERELLAMAADVHATLNASPRKQKPAPKEKREDEVDNAREDDEEDESAAPAAAPEPAPDTSVKYTGTTGVFGEIWSHRRERYRQQSPFGHLKGWDVRAFIVKNGDFVLQEQFVMQLLTQFNHIFEETGLPLRLRTYRIMALNHDCGFIEYMHNTISIDKLKSRTPNFSTLAEFFKREWPEKEAYNKARDNFVNSLAAYSLVCYFLQIKDRHNGNIMLDEQGSLLHIDFGYLLARTIKFEKAPFKLTEEMMEVIGGEKSKLFKRYVELLVQGFLAIRLHYEKILMLVEMTLVRAEGEGQFIPCLDNESVVKNLRKRFRLDWNEAQIRELVMNLVVEARDNWRTTIYDTYQRILNDIY